MRRKNYTTNSPVPDSGVVKVWRTSPIARNAKLAAQYANLGGKDAQEYAEQTGVQPANDRELHVELPSYVCMWVTIASKLTHNTFDSLEVVSSR